MSELEGYHIALLTSARSWPLVHRRERSHKTPVRNMVEKRWRWAAEELVCLRELTRSCNIGLEIGNLTPHDRRRLREVNSFCIMNAWTGSCKPLILWTNPMAERYERMVVGAIFLASGKEINRAKEAVDDGECNVTVLKKLVWNSWNRVQALRYHWQERDDKTELNKLSKLVTNSSAKGSRALLLADRPLGEKAPWTLLSASVKGNRPAYCEDLVCVEHER